LWFICLAGRSRAKNTMVMLVLHTEITTRHKDKAILYWFGPPESKTLRPVLQFVLLVWRDYMTTCRWSAGCMCWPVPGRTPLSALYWATDKVGGLESRSVTIGKPISSLFTLWKAYPSCLNPSGLSCLARQAVFSSGEGRLEILLEGLQEVVWAAN
jgi:hypothetical protein